MLRQTLSQGVALLHEGLSPAEVQVVHDLFSSGAVQVRWPGFYPAACSPARRWWWRRRASAGACR
jgi:hypothetical protein